MSRAAIEQAAADSHAAHMFSIEQLRQRLPVEAPIERPLRSGYRALDRLLGAGGLGAGQLVEWVGGPSSGKTGLLRAVVDGARRQGIGVAWIDAARQLCPADWAAEAAGRLWVLRPPEPAEGLFCAEVILRSRCFGLVVLDGAPAPPRAVGVRLQRLARQATSTLVVVRPPDQTATGGRVGRRFVFGGHVEPVFDALERRGPLTWRIAAARERGGPPGDAAPLHLVEAPADRLTTHALTVDRPGNRTRPGTRYGR